MPDDLSHSQANGQCLSELRQKQSAHRWPWSKDVVLVPGCSAELTYDFAGASVAYWKDVVVVYHAFRTAA